MEAEAQSLKLIGPVVHEKQMVAQEFMDRDPHGGCEDRAHGGGLATAQAMRRHEPSPNFAPMQKHALLAHLITMLDQRVHALKAELATTLEARNSDTKSSAGDKHEVGRAMVQQELDQLDGRLAVTQSMQKELERVDMDQQHDRVGFGSLVVTDNGVFFIAIAFGSVEVGGGKCYAISLASPMGQALLGKRIGEVAVLNGRSIRIETVN